MSQCVWGKRSTHVRLHDAKSGHACGAKQEVQDDLSHRMKLRHTSPEFQLSIYPPNGAQYVRHRDAFPDDGSDEHQRKVLPPPVIHPCRFFFEMSLWHSSHLKFLAIMQVCRRIPWHWENTRHPDERFCSFNLSLCTQWVHFVHLVGQACAAHGARPCAQEQSYACVTCSSLTSPPGNAHMCMRMHAHAHTHSLAK